MKRSSKKSDKTVRGTPTAVAISILIHAGLFLLAGMFVVFTVVKHKEVEFEPPKPVERPKMKLKKPKVRVRKNTKPRPTAHIVTKVKSADMPDIRLPEVSGMAEGLAGGIGGFDMMPDIDESSLFGDTQSIGNDLEGTFYDFRRDRKGKPIIMDPDKCIQILTRFVRSGWKTTTFSRYYRSPKKLYTTAIAIPPTQSVLAPLAFGEDEKENYCFAVLYKGQLVYKDDITFRFWGLGDDVLIVRVDGKVVLHAPYPRDGKDFDTQPVCSWQTSSPKSRMYWLGDNLSTVGDWITLEAGKPLDLEILIAEVPGGIFQALLTVEVKGEKYPRNPDRGGPTLPLFKTAPLSLDQQETIADDLDAGDACLTNGPVFCDYEVPSNLAEKRMAQASASNRVESLRIVDPSALRTWTPKNGKPFEARYVMTLGGKVVLKSASGRQKKYPLDELSEADRTFIEFSDPPKFKINFSKQGQYVAPPPTSPYEGRQRPLRITDFIFKADLKPTVTKVYPHELTVEFFAIGEEVDGNNYVLLDYEKAGFVPSAENKGMFTLSSPRPVRIQSMAFRDASPMHGTKYGGYLVVVTDERGEIIQYKASHKWLLEIIEQLRQLPQGKHFNKQGERVFPPRPVREDRPYWI